MNIYLHLEIISRELDSKILLATLAASKGHEVVISDIESIEKGLRRGALSPGIFHTKSLTPSKVKIALHQELIKKGVLITSIDEEGGLVIDGYDDFAKIRYSDQTIKDSSAIFGWGTEDIDSLKKIYPKYLSKLHKTGSPRADMWKSSFINYWGIPKKMPKKPFLLVVSNMTYANSILPFHKIISSYREKGYFKYDSELLTKNFGMASEHYLTTAAFIKGIKYLAKFNKGYEIVLRPHPAEKVESWKDYLNDIPNVHVIREGSITPWVNNSFAVMHNGCTTALEATVAKKPIITYVPYKQNYTDFLPNKLGHRVESLDELLRSVNSLFENIKFEDQEKIKKIPDQVLKKIHIDNEELSAAKMIKVWEDLVRDKDVFIKSSNWLKFQFLLKAMKINGLIGKSLSKFSEFNSKREKDNQKFPPFNINYINEHIKRLQEILGINKKIECKLLSDRTILIKHS